MSALPGTRGRLGRVTEVFIAGVGMTRFGRRPEPLADLVLEAAERAIADSGIEEFDAVFVGAMAPETFLDVSNMASVVVDHLGLVPAPAVRVETASSTGAALFDAAYYAVASGKVERALLVAGEVMTRVSTRRATTLMTGVIDGDERAHGATMPALAGLSARRYMHEYGLTPEEMALVAVKNHRNGVANPHAQIRKEITVEEAIASKIVSDPLRLYDCAPISDGAAAVVLVGGARRGAVRVAGLGHATDRLAVEMRDSLTTFASTRLSAAQAYRRAGIGPSDIGVAEVHDAFTIFEIIGTEDLGFFAPGEGRRAVVEGATGPEGRIPVNLSGGLKARGHPVGASGLAQIVELTWQLRGEAAYPSRPARWGLAQSIGGLATNNLVTILEAPR